MRFSGGMREEERLCADDVGTIAHSASRCGALVILCGAALNPAILTAPQNC